MCTPTAGDVASEDACARRIVAAFGRRAWRRPLTDDEVAGLAGLLSTARAQGEGFETGIARLEASIELAKRDLTIRLGAMIGAGVVFLSAVKFFGH